MRSYLNGLEVAILSVIYHISWLMGGFGEADCLRVQLEFGSPATLVKLG